MREFIIQEDYIEGGYLELESDYIERECKELIRCMDCKYWSAEIEQTAIPNMHKCTWWRTIGTLPIDFCSRAERRGEE